MTPTPHFIHNLVHSCGHGEPLVDLGGEAPTGARHGFHPVRRWAGGPVPIDGSGPYTDPIAARNRCSPRSGLVVPGGADGDRLPA